MEILIFTFKVFSIVYKSWYNIHMGHFFHSVLNASVFLPAMFTLKVLKDISDYFRSKGIIGRIIGFLFYVIGLPFHFIVGSFK